MGTGDRWATQAGRRRRSQYRRRFDTKAEARKELVRLRHLVDTGTVSDARRLTLAEYLEQEWLPAVSRVSKRGKPLAATTRQRYAQAVGRAVASIGDVRVASLRPAHVERLRDEMLGRGLAPQTVGDNLRVLAQGLRKAVATGLIPRNVADASIVDRPSGKPKPLPLVTPEMGQAILASLAGEDPWDVAVHLALGCTLRREEVLGLAWAAVDLEAGRLEVRQHESTSSTGRGSCGHTRRVGTSACGCGIGGARSTPSWTLTRRCVRPRRPWSCWSHGQTARSNELALLGAGR
jgi:integrase